MESWKQTLEYGGHQAAVMVMSVIANRVRSGWGTWLDTIARIPVFSAEIVQPNRDAIPNLWEPNFVRLLHEVEAVYDSSKDHSSGALYWCDTRRIETNFFRDKILGNRTDHPRIADMGTLTLFR